MSNSSHNRRRFLQCTVATAVWPLVQACDSIPVRSAGNATSKTDGSELAVAVYNALKQSPFTSQVAVNISSVEDEVIIKGFVNDRNEMSSIEDVASRVAGVRHVLMDVYIR